MYPMRDELKYLITLEQRNYLREKWRRFLHRDPYANKEGLTPILSLYYDSPHLHFYVDKIDGIKYRNKIRLRTYDNAFKIGAPVFLEIKQRYNDKVHKIRFLKNHFDIKDYQLENWLDLGSDDSRFKSGHLQKLIQEYRPKKAVQVFYMREPFQAVVEKDVRVTFDSHISGFYPDESITSTLANSPERLLMSDRLCVLEIKSNSILPRWVLAEIKNLCLNQISIPKYVGCMDKLRIPQYNHSDGVFI